MNYKKNAAILNFFIISAYCLQAQTAKQTKKPTESTAQLIQGLEKQVASLNFRVWQLENNEKSITFDPSNTDGFLRLHTNNGDFIVSLKNVEPYLNGVKVTISIGNLYSANFNGFKLHVDWGNRLAKGDTDWITWINSLNKNDFTFTTVLRGGAWSNVTFILAPIKPDNLGYLNLSMETNIVSLQNPFP